MKLPKGYTEEQFLLEVERVVRLLAPQFQTYQDDIEDVKQEARMWAIEGIGRYDPAKSKLGGFLYTHLKNRLTNSRRNQYFCGECPCNLCRGCGDGGTRHEDRMYCNIYLEWIEKNNAKQNVATPTSLSNADDDTEEALWTEIDYVGEISLSETLSLIDEKIPLSLRPSYLRMREGVKGVSRENREAVMAIVREVIDAEV